MSLNLSAVVKKGRVKETGAVRLGPERGPSSARGGPAPGPSAAAAAPAARIVEQHEDRAVVEITCACGRVTRLQCRWPPPAQA